MLMEPRKLEVGEIVQIGPQDPGGQGIFRGCLMVVSHSHPWGAQGIIYMPGRQGVAPYRVQWPFMEPTGGHVRWDEMGKPLG
jgi:hypothetical protein